MQSRFIDSGCRSSRASRRGAQIYRGRTASAEALERRTLLSYSVSPNPASVNENAGSLIFTVIRSTTSTSATVYISTVQDQGYTNNGYYVGLLNQPLSFSSGQNTAQVPLTINDKGLASGSETFRLIVQQSPTDPTSTFLATDNFTIVNNDPVVTTYSLAPNPATVHEDGGSLAFTVSRSSSGTAATVYVSTVQDQGYSNSGYYVGLVNQPLSLTAGQSAAQISVAINDLGLSTGSETFRLVVQHSPTDPTNTYLATDNFTIVNDDPQTTYSIAPNPASIRESAGNLTLTINRSNSAAAATVYASTVQDQGYNNNGYYTGLANQPIGFVAGQSSAQVSIAINDLGLTTGSETFRIIVQRSSSDPVSTYLATDNFTIIDNDPALYSIAPSPASIHEDGGQLTFTITRSRSATAATLYASTVQDQGYSNNGFYVGLLNQPINFSAGQSSAQVSVTINDLGLSSGSEIFRFIVQQSPGDPIGTYLATNNFTIIDDDMGSGSPGPMRGLDARDTSISTYASQIKADGNSFIGQYIGRDSSYLSPSQAAQLEGAGLQLFSIYEKSGMADTDSNGNHTSAWQGYFSESQGEADAGTAYVAATQFAHQPFGSAVYFAIDLDPANTSGITETTALNEIDQYFRGLQAYFNSLPAGSSYQIGVYGAGDTLTQIMDDGLAKYSWLASPTSWAGFRVWDPPNTTTFSWNIHQVQNFGTSMYGGIPIDTDETSGLPFGAWNAAISRAAAPIVSPNGGSFTGPVTITLATATPGATIRYTTDGSDPTAASTLYAGPFLLSNSATVKAQAFEAGYTDSDISSAMFNIPVQAQVLVSVQGGPQIANGQASPIDFDQALQGQTGPSLTFIVHNSGDADLTIGPVSVPSGFALTTLPQQPVPAGQSTSFVVQLDTSAAGRLTGQINFTTNDPNNLTFAFPITGSVSPVVATPTISPNGGTFAAPVLVTLASGTADASIYYTSDGSDPTTSSSLYNGPFLLFRSAILKVRGFRDGYSPSTISSAPFTLTTITVTNLSDAGPGSLREAITAANSRAINGVPGHIDAIRFDIPGDGQKTILLNAPLPAITAPSLTIDGTTQPGFGGVPLIALQGAAGVDGLTVLADGCVVRGLAIEGVSGAGIVVGDGTATVTGATITGNYIGVDPATGAAAPNGEGIQLDHASGVTIGGTAAGDRNVISGNTGEGIALIGGASGNEIEGNYIGTNAAGTAPLANMGSGVAVRAGSNNNTVEMNLISGNVYQGLYVDGDGSTGNHVASNRIGTDGAGDAAIPNEQNGVLILSGGTGTVITGNTLSGNTQSGVALWSGVNVITGNTIDNNGGPGIVVGDGTAPVTGATITGNYIGLDPTTGAAAANAGGGIELNDATGVTIGDTAAADRNVISGNAMEGIALIDGASANEIEGNYIGTNAAGTDTIPNRGSGVAIRSGSSNNVVETNLISGNTFQGLYVDGASTGNRVASNRIGTNATGDAAIPNGQNGVLVFRGGTGTVITGNTISGNTQSGVALGSGANLVVGNFIGTSADGVAVIGNHQYGVEVSGGAGDTIGGTAAGDANVIANNGRAGVAVTGAGTVGNAIEGNSIYGNGTLGIDLGEDGMTANSPGGPHTGANDLQNYPVLAMATSGVGGVITGTLNSTPNGTFRIEFFANAAPVAGEPAEGQRFLGSEPVTVDGSGQQSFTFTIPTATLALTPGQFVTATATDAAGNTSEFSAAIPVTTDLLVTNLLDAGPGSLRYEIGVANTRAGADTIRFASGLSGTITLTSGELDLSDTSGATLIEGPGDGLLTVSGNHASRVFHVEQGVGASISNLSIVDGHSLDGQNTDSGPTNPVTTPAEWGGGIYNAGALQVTDCIISGNSAGVGAPGAHFGPGAWGAGDVGGSGGGIFNSGTLTLVRTTIANNSAGAGGIGGNDRAGGPGGDGGGILNSGTLTADQCTIEQNSAGAPGGAGPTFGGPTPGADGGSGGGIYTSNVCSLSGTTLSNNNAANGGNVAPDAPAGAGGAGGAGGGLLNTGSLVCANCTFYANRAGNGGSGGMPFVSTGQGGPGGAGGSGGAISNSGAVTLTNCTVSSNLSGIGGAGGSGGTSGVNGPAGPGGYGGGIVNAHTASVGNTLVAGNDPATAPAPDVSGGITSFGHNLIGMSDGSSGWGSSDLTGTGSSPLDAHLSPFAAYGGPVETLALRFGSPAIDAGNNSLALMAGLTTDARGFMRVFNGTVDIGAFEAQPSALAGDVNHDGTVAFSDLLTLAQNYGATDVPVWESGDQNGDGTVGFADLLILAQNYGHSLAGTAPAAASADSASLLLKKRLGGR